MNAMTMSTNGTTMMSVTAPVLRDAPTVLPKRPSSRLCPDERFEQLIKEIAEEDDTSVEEQRGATLPRELILHLLRI
jgi:hypothetical protein